MGACGCADYNGQWRLAGPKGLVYVVEVYDGCEYCETPAGVRFYRFGKESARDWNVRELPDLLANHGYSEDGDTGDAERLVGVVDGAALRDVLGEELLDDVGDATSLLRDAVATTQAKERESEARMLEAIARKGASASEAAS